MHSSRNAAATVADFARVAAFVRTRQLVRRQSKFGVQTRWPRGSVPKWRCQQSGYMPMKRCGMRARVQPKDRSDCRRAGKKKIAAC